MRPQHLEAVVLRRVSIGEADKIIIALTREMGKVRLLAKGVRKIKSRRAPHLELFNHVSLVVSPRGQHPSQITEAKTISSFPLAKTRRNSPPLLFFLSEVLVKILPEHQPAPSVFNNLVATLHALSAPNLVSPEEKIKQFGVELLWELGYLPKGHLPKAGISHTLEQIIENKLNSKSLIGTF